MAANDRQPGGTHYKDRPVQPWDYIHRNGLGFLAGNVVKYVTRYKDKGGVEDLKKAQHYLEKLIEEETGLESPPPVATDQVPGPLYKPGDVCVVHNPKGLASLRHGAKVRIVSSNPKWHVPAGEGGAANYAVEYADGRADRLHESWLRPDDGFKFAVGDKVFADRTGHDHRAYEVKGRTAQGGRNLYRLVWEDGDQVAERWFVPEDDLTGVLERPDLPPYCPVTE